MKRADHRSKEEFSKDIYFGTQLEAFFFDIYLKEITNHYGCKVIEVINTGVDNSGKIVKHATGEADFRLIFEHDSTKYDYLLEVKMAPTAGKFTFKVDNLKWYEKEGSHILMFYNSGPLTLKKPKDHNLETHKALILQNLHAVQWGIITNPKITELLKLPVETPYYMGSKPCIILQEKDFDKYVTLFNLKGKYGVES